MSLKLFLTGFFIAAALTGGAENVIAKFKDKTLDSSASKDRILSTSFYIFKENARKLAGKTVLFRATLTRTEGNAPLSGIFRCSTNPGNVLRVTKQAPVQNSKTGEAFSFEADFPVPELENIHHFNMHLGFRQNGTGRNVWKIENPRFVMPEVSSKPISTAKESPALSVGVAQITDNAPLELVKEKKILFQIVIPDAADPIAKYAANELRDHFKLTAGSAPSVVRESDFKGGTAIFIGGTEFAKKYGIDPAMLSPETLVVARAGNGIILSGGDRPDIPAALVSGRAFVAVGTLYAVYEFLENQLGIRWFWPGPDGTLAPECRNLAVGKLYLTSRPVYDTRKTFYSIPRDPEVRAHAEQWYRRNRFGGSVGDPVANHSFNAWPKKFGKTHPEYLALQADGTRKTSTEPAGGHVCMSNPDVLKETVNEKLDIFRKNRFSNFSAVMPGDSNGLFHCRCADCQKKIQPERGSDALYSDTVWSFVNKVAAQIATKAPGKVITCCAYGDYLRKPSFPLLPNVAVTLCFSPVPRGSLDYKKAWKELLDEWGSTGASLYVWEYWNASRYGRGTYGVPAIFPRQLKEIYAMDAGRVRGRAIELSDVDTDGKSVNGWADWIYDIQNLYVAGKLMWNPAADIDKVLDEYYSGFFGPAAAPVRQFHEEMEQAWLRAGWAPGKWNFVRCWKELYPPEFVDRMMALLKQAVELSAGKEPYSARTRKLLAGYQPFDRNSRMFRGGNKITNPAKVEVPLSQNWNKALELKNFRDSYNVYEQASRTTAKLRHDGKTLFVRFECTIPDGVATVEWAGPKVGQRDGFLWNYESVEFFLVSGNEMVQFILAPDDKLADFRHRVGKNAGKASSLKESLSWNCDGVKFSAREQGQKWSGELEIPLKSLNFAEKEKDGSFRFNVYRNCRYVMPGEPAKWEQSCYLPVFGGFHNTERFGSLSLGK